MNYIYALVDPFSLEIRYIGRATDYIRRYTNHMASNEDNNPKQEWIRYCLLRGRKPFCVVLEIVGDEDASRKEQLWVKYCEAQGANLTNVALAKTRYSHCHLEIENVRGDCYYLYRQTVLRFFSFNSCLKEYYAGIERQRVFKPMPLRVGFLPVE